MNYLLDALIKKLEGEIAVAKANVDVYLKGSVGIGEHTDILTQARHGSGGVIWILSSIPGRTSEAIDACG